MHKNLYQKDIGLVLQIRVKQYFYNMHIQDFFLTSLIDTVYAVQTMQLHQLICLLRAMYF